MNMVVSAYHLVIQISSIEQYLYQLVSTKGSLEVSLGGWVYSRNALMKMLFFYLSSDQNPRWWGYIGDYTIQL